MTRDELEKIKGLSAEEINAKMSSGEIVIPPKGKDRDDLLRFATLPANSGERNAFLDDIEKVDGTPPEGEPPVAQEPQTDSGVGDTPPAPEPAKEGESSEPKWKQMGFDSEESALGALEKLRNSTTAQQQALDRFNAERGKTGQKLKDAQARIAEKEKELEALQAKLKENAPAPTTRPKIPALPSADDFDDGIADDGYTAALAKYRTDLSQYEASLEAYDTSIASRLAELDTVVSDLRPKVEKATSYVSETAESSAVSAVKEAWSDMWTSSKLGSFTKEFQLDTSVSPQRISDAWAVINSDSPDPGSLAVAQATVNGLSDLDKKNYTKIKQALESFYDFSTGVPRQKDYRTFKGCLSDLGLISQFKYEKPVEPTKDEQRLHDEEKLRKESEASGLPSGKEDGARIEDSLTPDEKKVEYTALLTEYNTVVDSGERNATAWEATPKFKRLKELRLQLTGRLPQFHKSSRYP